MSAWREVLDFWFGAPSNPEFGRPRANWFCKAPDFDAAIRSTFGATCEAAANGALAHWLATPLASLTLIVVLDQFPRNIFRGTPRAFGSDTLALASARHMVERSFDRLLLPVQRWFVYLPFEHSEDLAAQRKSLALFSSLGADPASTWTLDYARRHYDVIARFGRFPHRNSVLGRASTPHEIEFLSLPGSAF